MNSKNSILAVALGVLVAAIAGCSDLKNDLPSPVASGVQVHRPEWIDTSSANFHGNVIREANGDVRQCLTCHGLNYQGGASGVSCVKCHQERGASLHGRGWTDKTSSNFHGTFIRSANWDMRSCQSCHGTTYDGGKVGVSCRGCHTGGAGPENCATCHGGANPAPPRDLSKNTVATARGVGAHQVHLLGTSLAGVIACGECHVVPGSVYESGHIDSSPGAELRFNSLASAATNEPWTEDYDPQLPTVTPTVSYGQTTLKCSNTYCHGNFKNGNPTVAPTWTDVTGVQSKCGTCHGDLTHPLGPTLADTLARYVPKTDAPGQGGTHPNIVNGAAGPIRCSVCHAGVVDDNFRIIDPTKHINGKLNILDEFGFQVERDY